MVVKPTKNAHSGSVANKVTFNQAYKVAQSNPEAQYHTPGNHTPFTMSASHATRGKHEGDRVIIFRTNHREMARSYECCWGHITNCNRTYIDCYTSVLQE